MRKCILFVLFAVLAPAAGAPAPFPRPVATQPKQRAARDDSPLRVAVTVRDIDRFQYRADLVWHTLVCTVRNITNERQHVLVWSCGRSRNWQPDSDAVTFFRFSCESNYPQRMRLEPGEEITHHLPVTVALKNNARAVRFRLAFVPYVTRDPADHHSRFFGVGREADQRVTCLEGRFWSNEITIPRP
jgi:hypothetical protein